MLLIGDPCYVSESTHPAKMGWDEFCETVDFEDNAQQLNNEAGHTGLGVLVSTGFYHRFQIADAETFGVPEAVVEQIRAIRLQMKEAHLDCNGTVDGALFARLSGELRRLREALAKITVSRAA